MKKEVLALEIVAVLLTLPVVLFASDYDNSDEAWKTWLDLKIINTVFEMCHERDFEVELPTEWVSIGSYSKHLPETYRSRLPSTDGWGHDFLIGAVDDRLVVLSVGQNGVPDSIDPLKAVAEGIYEPASLTDLYRDDIVLFVGEEVMNHPQTPPDRQAIASADIRRIGSAVETYSIVNDHYPGQPEGLLDLSNVKSDLESTYFASMPMKDPWGNNYLYWSNEAGYVIVSMGSDGHLDRSYGVEAGSLNAMKLVGEFDDTRTDIVFADGQFVQWPRSG